MEKIRGFEIAYDELIDLSDMPEKKTRRRPNFFDILFVVLILAVAATAWFLSHRETATAETRPRTYMVELVDMEKPVAESIQVGAAVRDNVKNLDMGVVTAVEVVPSTVMVLDEEAEVIRQAVRPDRYNVHVTIQAETLETATSVETAGGYVLRVGGAVSCTVGGTTGSGYILVVER